MNLLRPAFFACLIVFAVSACGEDRSALARGTIQDYWGSINHGQMDKAYSLLTSGNQASKPRKAYTQDMFGFLQSTNGLSVKVKNVEVTGDQAVAAVTLISPAKTVPLNAYQHLFWENGGWRISDEGGGLSRKK